MSETPWSEFHRRWPKLKPPLRPNEEVVAAVRGAIEGHADRALLLGLTPELGEVAQDTVAVDWSEKMLAIVWPGNTATRRAVRANWLHLPCKAGAFSAAIGDGSLNCLEYPRQYRLIFEELARALRPGARLAIRMFLTPDPCETLGQLQNATMAGSTGVVDALKWRIAHALCSERHAPNIAVRSIRDAFNTLFPDRAELARACHWSMDHIEQIDAYANLPDVFSFPTEAQVLETIPASFARARFVSSGSYELAERCPILTAELRP